MSENTTDKVYLKLDVEELTFDEMIAIQEGNLRAQKGILKKFATDASGRPLAPEAADEAIGKLTLRQMRETFKDFAAQIAESMQDTLPNGRG